MCCEKEYKANSHNLNIAEAMTTIEMITLHSYMYREENPMKEDLNGR
jgi:hypothetical protein